MTGLPTLVTVTVNRDLGVFAAALVVLILVALAVVRVVEWVDQ